MTLEINGNTIEFSYGLYFLGKAQKQRKQDMVEMLNDMATNISDSVDLMYLSAEIECELNNSQMPITKKEFVDFLEKENDFKNTEGYLAKWAKELLKTVKGHFLPEQEGSSDDVKKK